MEPENNMQHAYDTLQNAYAAWHELAEISENHPESIKLSTFERIIADMLSATLDLAILIAD